MSNPNQITESQLFEIGFRRYGDDDEDYSYRLIFKNEIFGAKYISGNFRSDGSFEIWSLRHRVFQDIQQVKDMFDVLDAEVDWDITNRYGSGQPKGQK